MNVRTFLALLARDARVARRNFIPLLLQTLLQPMLLALIVSTRPKMKTRSIGWSSV